MFSHLEVRSAYSLHHGPRRIEDLVARAADLGYTALGLTDLDNLYGVHSFLEAARSAGLKPIVGASLGLPQGRLLAWAMDREGFGNLCVLISRLKEDPRPPSLDEVAALSGGLVLAASEGGLLGGLAGKARRLYAALRPRGLAVLPLARRHGLPLLALGDAAFLEAGDYEVHRTLVAIGQAGTVGDLDPRRLERPDALLLGPAEAEKAFAAWPEALAATEEVVEACAFGSIFESFVFPAARESREAARAELRARAYEGALERYGEVSDAVVERLEYELGLIGRKGFSDYFLVVAEIAAMTSRTCGRGSGAASAVAYCLGITNVDPIAHNLYFERFLNESRPDPPDIDIDFAWDERDGIIRRAIARFGEDRAARVANHLFFRPRSALREAARAQGLPEGEVAACAEALFEGGAAREAWEAKPLWAKVLGLARAIEGLPQGLSLHCGGLVVAPGPIRRLAPVERSPEGYPLLQWEKDGTEAAGLVKIDLLGNRSLAVIRDAIGDLERRGEAVAEVLKGPGFEALALGDPEVEAMLARGDSMGVFYIESPAMRQLQKKAGVGDYDHIVIHSSIIRPAANTFITQYVERLKGAPWDHLHPRLAKVLDETFGILVYQEDVSKAAIALAGFDECEADGLRKTLAKKNKAAKLAEYHGKFFAGCAALGVPEATAEAVWLMMESFAGYSFCKPHSASYALVSFQSAWLRRHHPAEFMAAVLSNQGGFYTPSAYVSEARRMGLGIAGPDVTSSDVAYRGEGSRLVVGLMAVGRLSRSAMEAIVAERDRGPFAGPEDFIRRLPRLETSEVLTLVEAGACDALAPRLGRASLARRLLCAREAGRASRAGAADLFSGVAESTQGSGPAPAARRTMPAGAPARPEPGLPRQALLEAEYRALGFLRDCHPLELWRARVDATPRTAIADLEARVGRRATVVALPVTRKEVLAEGREDMCFISLEDETGLMEAVLFPEAYRRFSRLLYSVRPLVVSGRVADDLGALSFEIDRVALLGGGFLPGKMGPGLAEEGLGVLHHGIGGPELGAEVGRSRG